MERRYQPGPEMDRRYRDPDFLRHRYVEAGESAAAIADDCSVSERTPSGTVLSETLTHYGILSRTAELTTQTYLERQ